MAFTWAIFEQQGSSRKREEAIVSLRAREMSIKYKIKRRSPSAMRECVSIWGGSKLSLEEQLLSCCDILCCFWMSFSTLSLPACYSSTFLSDSVKREFVGYYILPVKYWRWRLADAYTSPVYRIGQPPQTPNDPLLYESVRPKHTNLLGDPDEVEATGLVWK